MLEYNGKELSKLDSKELFQYWVNEREEVRVKKETGLPRPWTADPIIQNTYFTNIHRADDRVSKWLRRHWYTEYNSYNRTIFLACIARLINWPDTLLDIRQKVDPWQLEEILQILQARKNSGKKVWGGAYIVTTHGLKEDKLKYAVRVLTQARGFCTPTLTPTPTLKQAYNALCGLEAYGPFMLGQVLGDVKWYFHFEDSLTWSIHGPGSLKGLSIYHGRPVTAASYADAIAEAWEECYLYVPHMDNQDFQNCFCEYSKYVRVMNGGKSKRKYPQ